MGYNFLYKLVRPFLPKYYVVLWHTLPPSIVLMSVYHRVGEPRDNVHVLATNVTKREAKALIKMLPNGGKLSD